MVKRHRKWRCDDLEPVCKWLKMNSDKLPDSQEPLAVLSFLAAVQDDFSDKRSAAERRLTREPARIKLLRQQLGAVECTKEKMALRKLIFLEKVEFLVAKKKRSSKSGQNAFLAQKAASHHSDATTWDRTDRQSCLHH